MDKKELINFLKEVQKTCFENEDCENCMYEGIVDAEEGCPFAELPSVWEFAE